MRLLFAACLLVIILSTSSILHSSSKLSAFFSHVVGTPEIVVQVSESQTFPRLFFWDDVFTPVGRGRNISFPMTLVESLERISEEADHGTPHREFETEWFTECQEAEEIPVRPTCNCVHELGPLEGTRSSLLSMAGAKRSVWKIHDSITSESYILKVLHLHRKFTYLERDIRNQEMDIKVMERMTASPHVISPYGFCGLSALTEMAQSPGQIALRNPELSWIDRLYMARDLARGLAELHVLQPINWDTVQQGTTATNSTSFDLVSFIQEVPIYETPPVFAHYDINDSNVVSLQPKRVQWNDFNLGVITKHHINGSGVCPFPIWYKDDRIQWRSPEEIKMGMIEGHVSTLHPSDVYAFGNLLYIMYTWHAPWGELEENAANSSDAEIAEKKIRGDLPNLPANCAPQRQEAKIWWAATQACFRRDPRDRPTAYQLAVSLGVVLEWVLSGKLLSDDTVKDIFSCGAAEVPSKAADSDGADPSHPRQPIAVTPNITWLLSFPNSGTGFTLNNMRTISQLATATNYVHEIPKNALLGQIVIPRADNSTANTLNGPWKRDLDLPLPSTRVLCKNHCIGYGDDISLYDSIFSLKSFLAGCQRSEVLPLQFTYYKMEGLVDSVVHLIRDPFDNIVSRMNLALRKRPRGENKKYANETTLERLATWCRSVDEIFWGRHPPATTTGATNTSTTFIPHATLSKLSYDPRPFLDVPCHSEIFRYTQWHNLALELIRTQNLPVLTVYFEDFELSYKETSARILDFLGQTWARGEPKEESIPSKEYRHSFFTNAMQHDVERLIQEIASNDTRVILQRYFLHSLETKVGY